MGYVFECSSCGWKGEDPAFDPHLNPWCPSCGRPAEFEEVLRARRAR